MHWFKNYAKKIPQNVASVTLFPDIEKIYAII